MELLQLPLEIQIAILRALEYRALLYLSATNKHFREIFIQDDKKLLRHALLDFENKHCSVAWNTSLTNYNRLTPLPCYGCHKLLVKCYFTSSDWYSSSTRKGVCAFRRRCVTCHVKEKGNERFTRASRILRKDRFKGAWVYCAGCTLITHTAPLSLCGIGDHEAKVSFAGVRPVVPTWFRCTFCCEKKAREPPTGNLLTVRQS